MSAGGRDESVQMALVEERLSRVEEDVAGVRKKGHEHGNLLTTHEALIGGMPERLGLVEQRLAALSARVAVFGSLGLVAGPLLTGIALFLLNRAFAGGP